MNCPGAAGCCIPYGCCAGLYGPNVVGAGGPMGGRTKPGVPADGATCRAVGCPTAGKPRGRGPAMVLVDGDARTSAMERCRIGRHPRLKIGEGPLSTDGGDCGEARADLGVAEGDAEGATFEDELDGEGVAGDGGDGGEAVEGGDGLECEAERGDDALTVDDASRSSTPIHKNRMTRPSPAHESGPCTPVPPPCKGFSKSP